MATFTMPKQEKSSAGGSLASEKDVETVPPPSIHLSHDHLQKLGMKTMPNVGSKLKFHVTAHVGSTSENQDMGDGGKPRRHMTLDIHKMDMGTGKQSTGEPDEEQSAKGAKAEMDKALSRQEGSGPKTKPAGGKKA